MHRGLSGGHLQRAKVARVGGREVALLQTRLPGETVHFVVAQGLGAGVVGTEERRRLRGAMQGATSPGEVRLQAILEEASRSVGEAPREELEARGARIVEELLREEAGGRRQALQRALAKAISRVDRRIEAVRGDLERADEADGLGQRAQLFVVEAARARRGASELVAVDWSTGEAREIRLKIDPARGAQGQIDAMFKRARRLKEGAKIARARLADAGKARESLAHIAEAVTDREDPDLPELEAQARAAAPRDFKLASGSAATAGKRARTDAPRPAHRTFLGASGARILVGKGAEKNDELSFHVARPHDLWLHAKNRTGAHVVVPLDKGASCPAEVLVEAAHLAAHFSEARDEQLVEVQYTPRRYLRKPRGSAPGLVVVDREKVIALRKEEAVLRRVLEREVVE